MHIGPWRLVGTTSRAAAADVIRRGFECRSAHLGAFSPRGVRRRRVRTVRKGPSVLLRIYRTRTRVAVILPVWAPPMASVLIVDDEPAMRELMVRWAASLGLES